MDIMTPEEWNNENYPYPNCRSILHNGREMEKRMKEYSEYVLRESQKTETSDEALPIGDVVNWLPYKRDFADKYNELAKSGRLIKLYDDGTQIRHGEDEPIACVTHFREG